MDSDGREIRDDTTSSPGTDGSNVHDGRADRFRKLFGHGTQDGMEEQWWNECTCDNAH